MQNLIPVLNKLQDVFATVSAHAVDLPQIVAVGCQSAGKSSVLEAIVGKDFLPRGAGICTRRPLILQLIHIEKGGNPTEWGEFLHNPGKKYTNFDEIMKEIEDETDRVCGTNKGVTDQPINLKIYSPTVLNLTLVDLPGLTKIAVEDQPADIADQIKKMVYNYITPQNAIILAITPANMDLANSDSLIAAREVDPNGDRTIGVLTKLDIMDAGTNAREILLNKVYPLKLGYIGVINRSQADINAKKKVATTADAEMKFFKSHEAYADIAENCGTKFLSQTLNQILMKHIKNQIPALYTQINDQLALKNAELQKYGTSLGNTPEEQQTMIFSLVSKYMEELNGLLNGYSDQLSNTQLHGGANIISELIDEFPQSMLTITSVKTTPQELVAKMIESQGGLRGSMFFPEATFHALVKDEIEKLRPCVLKCIDNAKERLVQVHQSVHVPELERFFSLRDNILQIAIDGVVQASKEAAVYANKLIDIHTSFINTRHPDFAPCKAQIDANGGFGNNVPMLIDLVHRYFVIVRKEVIDSIPKAIFRTMLVDSVKQLRFDLVEKLVLEPDLNEDPVIVEKRNSCLKLIAALKQAQLVLADVRKAHV
ncbi:Dynamin central region family protein [Trichomonas vaginalis G3]|uniref:dynamin GTPase n=1 Tax=Trichomonas vaginalis (strain ATCC PRA-98 / G3) TaxID=412133 RepID=A2DFD2_TRIV3|nr:dynamin family [Trichomonas vaginalis G3]EAY20860.1 Dynamin central region family protein [Trichomonas vaginalis G3]KAI5521530.1 dynamin family [Trichomonas vaginalis G3]|eukprot:XP_001581846.1 Dynamin central region family protein [Trichomonas vaginalis G3]